MKKSKILKMKALSIAQPWAECIVSRGKNIENRTWNTRFRGYFAIHASMTKDLERFEYCKKKFGVSLSPTDVDLGAVIAIAELAEVIQKMDVTRDTKKWFQGDYGFRLNNVIKLKNPVKVKGALGFWDLKGKALSNVLDQLTITQVKKVSNKLANNSK